MAKIDTIKSAIMLCKHANITPFIWGHRGLGKSSLVKQLAEANQWGFIDLRCSQLEASDVRGLPERLDGRTTYLPPADMPYGDMSSEDVEKTIGQRPKDTDFNAIRQYNDRVTKMQPHYQHGILFLDEVNRAQDDVLQAIFQLVLDRKVGTYTLPPGWCVVAAGNFMEGYQVSGFNDPAFLNRFCHLTLSGGETTIEDWVDYMALHHGDAASSVIEFASQNTKHLDGDVTGELGFSIQPSRRSWEMVVRTMRSAVELMTPDPIKLEVIAGLIGRELSLSFMRYNCPVKPSNVIDKGVKACESALKKLNRNQLTGLMWGLVSYCKHQIEDDKIANVCLDFASFMIKATPDKDLVVAFCRALIVGGDKNDKLKAAVISNPKLAQLYSQFNKLQGTATKTFIDRLTERPELQEALSRVSWGVTDEDSKK